MVDPSPRAPPGSGMVDAGRCPSKGNSGSATDPFGGCRSGAARQRRGGVGVAGSVINQDCADVATTTTQDHGPEPPGAVPGPVRAGARDGACADRLDRP